MDISQEKKKFLPNDYMTRQYNRYPTKEAAKKAHRAKARRHWRNVSRIKKHLPPLGSVDTSNLTGSINNKQGIKPIEHDFFG